MRPSPTLDPRQRAQARPVPPRRRARVDDVARPLGVELLDLEGRRRVAEQGRGDGGHGGADRGEVVAALERHHDAPARQARQQVCELREAGGGDVAAAEGVALRRLHIHDRALSFVT